MSLPRGCDLIVCLSIEGNALPRVTLTTAEQLHILGWAIWCGKGSRRHIRLTAAAALPSQPHSHPDARADLLAEARGFRWLVQECPLCGRRHAHGGGPVSGDPRKTLGHRAGHCNIPNSGYILIDSSPDTTGRVLAAARQIWGL
jgi:hypothetical protein